MRILLSCYSCLPHRGSEPGVGWNWALGMAKRHETYVLTRAYNRPAIEEELSVLHLSENEKPHFIYVDLPSWILWFKRKGFLSVQAYYFMWQFAARRAFDKTGIKVDIIHHLTFCSYVIPGVWWHRKEKVVLGPLGGAIYCPWKFLDSFPPLERVKEIIRTARVRLWWINPFFRQSKSSASHIFFTQFDCMKSLGNGRSSEVMLDVAVPQELLQTPCRVSRARQFVWAGELSGRKGCDLALLAYARAFGADDSAPVLKIFGSGPCENRLKRQVKRLHVAPNHIMFMGNVSQVELWNEMRSSLAFVFTSLRDTCGSVTVESLANQTPLICFNHQGVATVADNTCAHMIEPINRQQAINDFAKAMKQFVDNPRLSDTMGLAGRNQVLSRFCWEQKFDSADSVYQRILGHV